MKKTSTLFLTIVLLFSSKVSAEVDDGIIKNPFIPQLPKKKIIVDTTAKPDVTNKTDIPNTKPDTTDTVKTGETTPVVPKKPPLPTPNFDVTAIIWNTNRPQAIINGLVVDIGDYIEEFRIESIGPTEIGVSFRGVNMSVKP